MCPQFLTYHFFLTGKEANKEKSPIPQGAKWAQRTSSFLSRQPWTMEALTLGSLGPRLRTGVAFTFVSGTPGVKVSFGRSCMHTERGWLNLTTVSPKKLVPNSLLRGH